MEDLLLAILEFLVEVALEIAGEAILDLVVRGIGALLGALFRGAWFELENPIAVSSVYLGLGAVAGGLSLFLFPHRIMRPSRIHGVSLVIGPLLAGAAMRGVGSLLRRYDKRTTQIETFWCAFAFALGMAVVRFLFVA